MFKSARFTLTLWYVVISMVVSIAFSIAIYIGATREFDRILRVDEFRREHPQYHIEIEGTVARVQQLTLEQPPDPAVVNQAKGRVLLGLLEANMMILLLSSAAGYFLAGRTLRPIQKMHDEQKQFISDSSHELNTPLTSLRTGLEVNLRNKKLSLADAKKVLVSNLEDVEKLQELTTELMELTQYEEVPTKPMLIPVSIQTAVTAAIKKVQQLADEKNIILQTTIPHLSVLAERKSLEELFVILLDNAIKYSPEKSTVSLEAEEINGKVKIAVSDTGIGISPEDIPHIFDRFYRADKSRSTHQTSGFGLGLSIAKRIVAMNKAKMSVASKVGEGTTFTLLYSKS